MAAISCWALRNWLPMKVKWTFAIMLRRALHRNVVMLMFTWLVTEDGVAKVWKNGVATILSNGNRSLPFSIFISGEDVYVAGSTMSENNIWVATLWKNGIATSLSDGISHTYASSVYVSENDVYLASYGHIENDKYVSKIWKNGIPNTLTDSSNNYHTYASSMYVSGNDVYVSGYEYDRNNSYTVTSMEKWGGYLIIR